MREILFKGITTEKDNEDCEFTNVWVVGDLIQFGGKCFIHPHCNRVKVKNDVGSLIIMHEVIPSTVSQCTGLTDKNGVKIFEWDIVHIKGNLDNLNCRSIDYYASVAFINGGFYALDGTINNHGFRRYDLANLDFTLEVIGNIYDNPELLEVSQ